MKKIILLFCLIAFAFTSKAQMANNKTALTKKDYLQKSKNKKTTAWVFLGTGTLCAGIGLLTFPKTYDVVWGFNSEEDENKATVSSVLFVGGIAFLISSIPFFVTGSIYKRKAGNLSIDMQQSKQLKSGSLYTLNQPALKLAIRL